MQIKDPLIQLIQFITIFWISLYIQPSHILSVELTGTHL